jgi:hypothetical protein
LFVVEKTATLRPSDGSRRRVEAIIAERERLLAEVGALRRRGQMSRFAENAARLLTRWWSTKNWTARARLLKDAEWLIRLERRRGDERQ